MKTDFSNYDFISTSDFPCNFSFNEKIAIGNNAVWYKSIHGSLKYSNNSWVNNNIFGNNAGSSNGIAIDSTGKFWGAMLYQSGGSGPSFYVCDDSVCSFQGSNTIGWYGLLCDGNNNLWTENYNGLYKYDGVN